MLMLSRKLREEIVLEFPEGIVVRLTVVAIRGNTIRLGFDGPRVVQILRDELLDHSPQPVVAEAANA